MLTAGKLGFGCLWTFFTINTFTACMPSHFSCVRLFATPWTVACQVPLVPGIFQTKYWHGLPCLPPGDLPNLGIKPMSPAAPALQTDSLPLSHQGKHNIFTTFLWIWNYSKIESVLKIILWGRVHSATMEMSLETLVSGEHLGCVRLSPPSSPQILRATLWDLYYSPHFTALNEKTMCTNIIHESSLHESEVQREQSPICWLKSPGQTWQSCDQILVCLTLKHMFISVPHLFPRILA